MKPDRGSGNLHKLCPNLSWVVVVVGGGISFKVCIFHNQNMHFYLICVSLLKPSIVFTFHKSITLLTGLNMSQNAGLIFVQKQSKLSKLFAIKNYISLISETLTAVGRNGGTPNVIKMSILI